MFLFDCTLWDSVPNGSLQWSSSGLVCAFRVTLIHLPEVVLYAFFQQPSWQHEGHSKKYRRNNHYTSGLCENGGLTTKIAISKQKQLPNQWTERGFPCIFAYLTRIYQGYILHDTRLYLEIEISNVSRFEKNGTSTWLPNLFISRIIPYLAPQFTTTNSWPHRSFQQFLWLEVCWNKRNRNTSPGSSMSDHCQEWIIILKAPAKHAGQCLITVTCHRRDCADICMYVWLYLQFICTSFATTDKRDFTNQK